MIRIPDALPGTMKWVGARLGIPTASQFHRILTPKTRKFSEQARGYAYELLAEEALGYPLDSVSSGLMERGTAIEQQAIDFYEFERSCSSERAGFVFTDDRRVGCTPDRFVGGDGGLEIKCPTAPVHLSYLLDEHGIGYPAQVQGCLWITGRQWWDTLSYHPDLPPALVRIERDEEFIGQLAEAMREFLEVKDDLRSRLRRRGLFTPELRGAA